MENKSTKNILGYESIPKLIIKISLPLMISMLVQALYNVVDSIFIAMVSETALTAVSLAFPLQNLLIAFAIGTAVGVNSFLGRKLGEGDKETAEECAGNGIFLAVATWLFFALIGIFGAKPFLSLYTDDPELLKLSTEYARIVLIFSFGCFVDITCERIMQATGDSFHPMLIQLTGATTNIILDPIFIFVFDMGVAGAAIATVIGQFVGMFVALYYVRKNHFIRVRLREIRPRKAIIKNIYAVGAPTVITNAIGTIMVSFMNSILIAFSATAVSVFGVYFKLQSFIFMPIFGLNAGMIAILAYNYGAGNKDRMIKTLKVGTMIAVSIMVVGFLLFQLCPELLLSLFSASDYMMAIGIPALRTISIHFIIAGFSIALMSIYQATGVGIASMVISISRQLLVLIPAAWILGRLFGLDAVWYSFIIAEIVSILISIGFFVWIYKTRIQNLKKRIHEEEIIEEIED